MNRSISPVLRPLSNISNSKLTVVENPKKESVRKTIIPKSTIEQPILQEAPVHAKSCITAYNDSDTSSRKSSVIRKKSHINQESKFFFFKIIVFLGVAAALLASYQLHSYMFGEESSKFGISSG